MSIDEETQLEIGEDRLVTQVEPTEEKKEEEVKDIQKVYIKNYGNLLLEILGTNEIGIMAHSTRSEEELFIPWTSVIFVSKTKDKSE
ncbi:MAG: hypothetical protein DRQ78_07660 [Epsilonproteobacteria bacterium]|nr:MAG: hypothetical protein DRQ78_07660 [Campylobacterota bacterium]